LAQRLLREKSESSAAEFLRPCLFQRRQELAHAPDPEPTPGIPLARIFEFHFDPYEPDLKLSIVVPWVARVADSRLTPGPNQCMRMPPVRQMNFGNPSFSSSVVRAHEGSQYALNQERMLSSRFLEGMTGDSNKRKRRTYRYSDPLTRCFMFSFIVVIGRTK
jgi:hypothetical protein